MSPRGTLCIRWGSWSERRAMRRSIRVERRLDAPPEAVFEVVADHARYDRFDGVRRSELHRQGDPSPNGLGAVRWVWLGPLRFEEEITAFEPPTRMDYLIRDVRGLPFRHEGGSIRLDARRRRDTCGVDFLVRGADPARRQRDRPDLRAEARAGLRSSARTQRRAFGCRFARKRLSPRYPQDVAALNVELHRRANLAIQALDADALVALSDPSIEVHSIFAAVGGAVYHGHDGVRRWLLDLDDAWSEFVIEPEAYFDLGESTLAHIVLHGRGRQSGAGVVMPYAQVMRWRDGSCVYFKAYVQRQDALNDLDISEEALRPSAL